jgi:hypothetical protein
MLPITYAFPIDGVMLTDAAGTATDEGLEIKCIINASPGRKITINGILRICTLSDMVRLYREML